MLAEDPLAQKDRSGRSPMEVFLLGRAMIKSGDLAQGRDLLKRAVEEDRELADAWVWLAMTTDKPAEQKECLDWALAANPGHAAARRWMAILTGKLKPGDLVAAGGTAAQPGETQTAANLHTFLCPRCGGSLTFDPETLGLRCAQCGTTQMVDERPAAAPEKDVDLTVLTRQGHTWAQAQRRQVCQQCGAVTVFPAGQASTVCPFCGATAFSLAPEDATLIAPQAIALMEITAETVMKHLRDWLNAGFFAPDDLLSRARENGLRPAYVPVWIFNCDVTVHWTAQLGTRRGRQTDFQWVQEQRLFTYTNHLQPGVRSLPLCLFRKAEPFSMSKLVEPRPEHLAGWPAAAYDLSLADATVIARGEMAGMADDETRAKAMGGRPLRDFQVGGHDFTGETYRLALLPVWLSSYTYAGKVFQVLVNGQTGKVAGDKPLDRLKVAGAAAVALAAVAVLVVLGMLLLRGSL
jgi:DNA-directed RNA polymerase subunit RPC12/RpoP